MSISFWVERVDAVKPVGSYGPVSEIDSMYLLPGQERRLDPSRQQTCDAGRFDGPNLSNQHAAMVLRSLGYDDRSVPCDFDPVELLGRVTLARAVPPVDDSGMAALTTVTVGGASLTIGAVRPGYFQEVYAQFAALCEQAIAWNSQITAS